MKFYAMKVDQDPVSEYHKRENALPSDCVSCVTCHNISFTWPHHVRIDSVSVNPIGVAYKPRFISDWYHITAMAAIMYSLWALQTLIH